MPVPIIQIKAPINIGEIPIYTTVIDNVLTTTKSIVYVADSPIISPIAILGIICLAGFLCFLIYNIHRHRKFLKLVKRFGEDIADEKIIDLLANVLGIKGKAELKTCFGTGSPMMIGFFSVSI